MQRRSGQVPPHLADLPVVAEQADVADLGALRAIGERHEITGIVHLAGYPAPRGTAGGIDATQGLLDGLLNIARAAAEWGVRRVSLASTLGVYGGIAHSGPLTEDLPVLLTAPHPRRTLGPHHPAAPRPQRLHLAQLADRRPRQAIPDRLRPRLTCPHFSINDLGGRALW
jgi:nucleoside-diphosphate-sugar epimerase